MFGLFNNQPAAETLEDYLATLMGPEFIAEHCAEAAAYEHEMLAVVTFLKRGFDQIAGCQARELKGYNPAGDQAATKLRRIERATKLSSQALIAAADSLFGQNRTTTGLSRLRRRRFDYI